MNEQDLELLKQVVGRLSERKPCVTLAEFSARWMQEHVRHYV